MKLLLEDTQLFATQKIHRERDTASFYILSDDELSLAQKFASLNNRCMTKFKLYGYASTKWLEKLPCIFCLKEICNYQNIRCKILAKKIFNIYN